MRHAPPPVCPRCQSRDQWDPPPAWLRWLQRAWVAGLLLLLPFTPIMMSDVMVMLPALAVYLLGAGPALAVGSRESICRGCGATWAPPAGRLLTWWRRAIGVAIR